MLSKQQRAATVFKRIEYILIFNIAALDEAKKDKVEQIDEVQELAMKVTESLITNPNEETIKTSRQMIFEMLLFRAKYLDLIPWSSCKTFRVNFQKGQLRKARIWEQYWRLICIIIYAIEVTFTAIDLILSKLEGAVNEEGPIKSEMENAFLDYIQISLALIAMYMLVVY